MSTFIFGVHRGPKAKLSARARRAYERAARANGARFIEAILPGIGYQRWFTAPNLGHPFDRATERAVYGEIDRSLRGA